MGLVTTGELLGPLVPFTEPLPLSFEMVRFEREWLRVVGGVDEEFKVDVDLVVGAVPSDLLSLEALSWLKLAFDRRLRSLKNGIRGKIIRSYSVAVVWPMLPVKNEKDFQTSVSCLIVRHDTQPSGGQICWFCKESESGS